MVLTRLGASLALKRFKRVSRFFVASSSFSDSCSANSTTAKDPETKRVQKKKERKKYSELPVIYMSPTGAPAAPLGEWFAGSDSDVSNLSEFLSEGNLLFFVLLIFKVTSPTYRSPGESCEQP
jgi:hypothetical protein